MATRRICPTPPRNAATVQMAHKCEGHVRILQEQVIQARKMTKLAHDMAVYAISMRRVGRLALP
jgi:hypothetical protein